MIRNAILCGPFIGETLWEYFMFSPYVINLKKRYKNKKIIVFTRPSSFDFYGEYVDVFVPLIIENDIEDKKRCFKMEGYDISSYYIIANDFYKKYKDKYKISLHIYPKINNYLWKVKWQFPRLNMDYDFIPRKMNSFIVDAFLKENNINKEDSFVFVEKNFVNMLNNKIIAQNKTFLLMNKNNYFLFNDMIDRVLQRKKHSISLYGCLMELINRSEMVVGSLNDFSGHMGILLKKELMSINDGLTEDETNLLNPYKTKIKKVKIKGVE